MDWDRRYADTELVWSRGPNASVVDQLADLPPGRALDLAGGEGRNAIWLAQRGWQVELVEFSQVALDKASRLAAHVGAELALTLGDVTGPLESAPADLVLLAYLQLPRDPSRAALRQAAQLVAPGGTLLLIAHARRNLTDGVGGPPDPAVLPTADEVVEDLAGSGLVITTAGEILRPVDTDDGPRDAVDLLVRATRPARGSEARAEGTDTTRVR